MSISEAEASELVKDRIKFKLYLAEKHFNKIVEFQEIETINFLRSNISRVRFEVELESLFAHLIGARDALLFRIRNNLGLLIKDKHVNLSKINQYLLWTKNRHLLCELCSVSHDGFWLDHLNELRNTGMHGNIIPIRKNMEIHEDLNTGITTSAPMTISFVFEDGQSMEIIPLLRYCIQKMKQLIDGIMENEPKLKEH